MAGTQVNDTETPSSKTADPVRPVRALMRGIDILQALNRHPNATVTDIANAVGLPRTTTYRILETLCALDLAIREVGGDQYRLTARVLSLSDGFDGDDWIVGIAKPALAKLTRDIPWPIALATLHGRSMLVREVSQGGKVRASLAPFPDTRLPLLGSSAGRVMLAMCGEEQRTMLLDILARSERSENDIARDRSLMNRLLAEIKNNGWAVCDDAGAPELGIAVPVMVRNRFLASLTMRFERAAIPAEQAVEKYVPPLKRAAADVAEAFEAYPSSAR